MTTSDSTTITIQLPRGYSTIIDIVDADLAKYKWSVKTPRNRHVKYVHRTIQKRPCRLNPKQQQVLHRVILERILGRPLLSTDLVDHIDGDGLNNRRSNLRLCTNTTNAINSRRRTNNSSGFKCVSFYKPLSKWRAYIQLEGRQRFLGYFDTPEEAHEAYKEAAVKFYGEFARFE